MRLFSTRKRLQSGEMRCQILLRNAGKLCRGAPTFFNVAWRFGSGLICVKRRNSGGCRKSRADHRPPTSAERLRPRGNNSSCLAGVVPVGGTCRSQISEAPGDMAGIRRVKMHARFARVPSRGNDEGGTVEGAGGARRRRDGRYRLMQA